MNYDVYDASKMLGKINLNLGNGMNELESYWCRVVLPSEKSFNPKPHRHSFFELHLCLSGSCDFTVANKKITITENTYLLMSPSTEHKIENRSCDFKKFIWGFSVKDNAVSDILYGRCANGYVGDVSKDILPALDIILENAYEKKFGFFDIIKGQLSLIYALIVRDICDIKNRPEYRKKPSFIVEDIKKYISDNLRICPTTEEIASQFSKSCEALDRLCISECGMSVFSLKKQLQFEKIKELLAETDLTLDAISDECGFADRFTMGKFFKKLEGMPPGEFRISIRK